MLHLLDVATSEGIIARLRQEHPAEAELTHRLIESYRFDRLIALCDESAAESSDSL